MVKIYVAGKWANKPDIQSKMAQFESLGHKITHNWTLSETTMSPGAERLRRDACNDIQGVVDADVLVVVMDDEKYVYRGTFCEIGCALGTNTLVIVYCPNPNETLAARVCFYHHKDIVHYDDWKDVVQHVCSL
jgi:hypothetical protein